MKRSILFLFPILLTVLAVCWALYRLQPSRESSFPPDRGSFSSGRAMTHLRMIASRSHSVGFRTHDQVRDYILKALKDLELEPVIQTTTSFRNQRAAVIENIIVKKPGKNTTRAILLSAHYDSRFLAPGAGDNGANAAAILEVLLCLQRQPPLNNDLVVIFTDGEEESLLGASAFIRESALSDNIGIVLNFDGRGSSGSSVMFETSPDNGRIIREMNQAMPSVIASSLTQEASRLITNYTDFTVFRQKIPAGLNFTHLGSVQYYHSIKDTPENFDERTMQSNGKNMLALVLHYGSMDLSEIKAPDVVYFPFLLPGLVIYPAAMAVWFSGLVTILFIAVIILGLSRKRLNLKFAVLAFFLFLLRILLTGLLVWGLWNFLGLFQHGFRLFEGEWVYNSGLFFTGFLLISLACIFAFQGYMTRKLGEDNLSLGALLTFMILAWTSAILMPGASYPFTWPLFSILAAFLIHFLYGNTSPGSPGKMVLFSLLALPGIFLFTQVIYLLYLGLTIGYAWIIVMMIVLISGTIQIPVAFVAGRRNWFIPAIFTGLAIIMVNIALVKRYPDTQSPRPDTIFYTLDADNGKARWVTWDGKTDEWTSGFFRSGKETIRLPEFLFFEKYGPFRTKPLISGTAPLLSSSSLLVEKVSDEMTGSGRMLKIRIQSRDSAFLILVSPEDQSGSSEVMINGKKEDPVQSVIKWPVMYFGSPGIPFDLSLKISGAPVTGLRIVEVITGLPAGAQKLIQPRPSRFIPVPGYFDGTLIGKTYRF